MTLEYVKLSDNYPNTASIDVRADEVDGRREKIATFSITKSPFHNCQSFTIGGAFLLKELSDELFLDFFRLTYLKTCKHQFVIDLNKEYLEGILKRLQPISTNIQTMEYINTNGSAMVLCLVQLNVEKLQ